jgi:hypothetical protein
MQQGHVGERPRNRTHVDEEEAECCLNRTQMARKKIQLTISLIILCSYATWTKVFCLTEAHAGRDNWYI